jgi:hypothetical protein
MIGDCGGGTVGGSGCVIGDWGAMGMTGIWSIGGAAGSTMGTNGSVTDTGISESAMVAVSVSMFDGNAESIVGTGSGVIGTSDGGTSMGGTGCGESGSMTIKIMIQLFNNMNNSEKPITNALDYIDKTFSVNIDRPLHSN